MKEITQKEHEIIMKNCLFLGKKINHPLELGEAQLRNVVACIRSLKNNDVKGGKAVQ